MPASLPATGIGSFRPGKASWGLTILEAESPILEPGKRLWKSRLALLVAESMGGPLADGVAKRNRAIESGAAAAEWAAGARQLDRLALGRVRCGLWPLPPRNRSYLRLGPDRQ